MIYFSYICNNEILTYLGSVEIMLSMMGSHICITDKKSDPMFNVSENELIKFTFVSFKVAKMYLSEYSCEKSKHTYTQHQLMALSCLMKR
jgi:hypothetical protein